MIDFGKILKRAWYILWNYRVLWIFGLLLALFGAGGGHGGNNSNYQFSGNNTNNNGNGIDMSNAGPWARELADWFTKNVVPLFEHPSEHIATFIWIGVAFFLFLLIVGAISAFIRYPSEVAVIRMVDGYEANGDKVGFRAGWKLGWNRRAFRLWVIDLMIGIPAFVVFLFLLILGIAVFIHANDVSHTSSVGLIISAVGCVFLLLFALIIFMVFLDLLRQFFARFIALEETGVREAFSQGWAFFKSNWKSAALMWLIMLGIGIGFGIAMIFVFFLLVPAYIILLIPAILVAAIPGLILFGIASLFVSLPVAAIIGGVLVLPLFFTILFAPLFLIDGWYQIFRSNVWTLTYREMKALNEAPAEPTPEIPPETA